MDEIVNTPTETWDDFVNNETRIKGKNSKIAAVRAKMLELNKEFLLSLDAFGVSGASIEQLAHLCLCHQRTLAILYKNALLGAIPNSFRRISMMRRVIQIHEGWWQNNFTLPYLDKTGGLVWGKAEEVDIMSKEGQARIKDLARHAWETSYSHLPSPKKDIVIPVRPDTADEKIR